MADRFAEPDDAAVDELKRRARRRLVGAIVLALAAAIVVPMLLEREPRPLGDEVSVQIPPVDEGKFVNRLNDAKAPSASRSASKAEPQMPAPPAATAGAPRASTSEGTVAKPIADVEQRVLAAPPQPPASAGIAGDQKASTPGEAKSQPPQSVAAAQPSAAKSEASKQEPAAKTATASAPAVASTPATASAATAASAAAAAANGSGFVVQLAAFADDKGANALAGKLKRAGYPAYTEPVQTSRGTLWRVRVGAYPSRDAATDARQKLKDQGYNGIIAAAN